MNDRHGSIKIQTNAKEKNLFLDVSSKNHGLCDVYPHKFLKN